MTDVYYKELQDSMPTFVKAAAGITWNGRFYESGKEFPWKTLGVTFDQARILFHSHQLFHSDKLTVEQKVGDGLDAMTIDQLNYLVDGFNVKVKANAKDNKLKYDREKCKHSRVVSKQRGLIRSWRSNFGYLENQ
jgi:hypothetical protein